MKSVLTHIRVMSVLVAGVLWLGSITPAWGQATPSTEGRDFWVTFLRAADDDPTELKLTISAKEACEVKIENTNTRFSVTQAVTDNSSTELVMAKNNCYSSTSESPTYTALHVTSTKDISLFAGNYRDKSFDATNVLPTSALLDDYLIQTYPPSDHEGKPQGSHFAIIAVEDGKTTVDYNLTAKTVGGKTGAQSVTLEKGQVFYVWTGKNEGDEADLSGTTVIARDGKKIAVFQGCPHTNIPYTVRDRDHIISQAMPIAYWGTEFGITASRHHRRDIIAVMAINDGTEVYINSEDGEKQLVHKFDFRQDKKHYWTFEIGEDLAYCADNAGQSPTHGQLPPPLVVDSSCYLTTSCPAGVHLFMVSNRYDNLTEKVNSDTLVSDPAMLWISPIEQVIKEINFTTYSTKQAKFHYMNILTTTSNTGNMLWNGNNIRQYFRPVRGNNDYSFARIQIQEGINHNLQGKEGFLAHVYGYGERESYAYSCGSSTVQRSVTFNGEPILENTVSSSFFCAGDEVDMRLRIGSNEYQSVVWNFGDGTVYSADPNASNDEKKQAKHIYTEPGWYDLQVSVAYVNSCTGKQHDETLSFSFRVIEPFIKYVPTLICHDEGETLPPDSPGDVDMSQCLDTIIVPFEVHRYNSSFVYADTVKDSAVIHDTMRYASQTIVWTMKKANANNCDSAITCNLVVIGSLDFKVDTYEASVCDSNDVELPYIYKKGEMGEVWLINLADNKKIPVERDKYLPSGPEPPQGTFTLPTGSFRPGVYDLELHVEDKLAEEYHFTPKEHVYPVKLTVNYSENIFKYKFNNVLAVYNKAHNGGYEFTAYQWYLNGQPIEGATESVYHINDGTFAVGDSVYVLLTDKAGNTLPSCAQVINSVPDFTNTSASAPVRKLLINSRLYINKGEMLYDIYGQRVQ